MFRSRDFSALSASAPIGIAAFLVLACHGDSPFDPAAAQLDGSIDPAPVSTALENRGQPDMEVPFRLDGSAVVLALAFAPDFGPPTFGRSDFGGRCSSPADFLIRFAVEGQARHLGRITAVAEHCSIVDFQTGSGTEMDGEMTIIAANGDELWDRYAGSSLPGQGFTEDHEFVGGTGRFAGASGTTLGRGMCDPQAGTCVIELDGVIVYDASAGDL